MELRDYMYFHRQYIRRPTHHQLNGKRGDIYESVRILQNIEEGMLKELQKARRINNMMVSIQDSHVVGTVIRHLEGWAESPAALHHAETQIEHEIRSGNAYAFYQRAKKFVAYIVELDEKSESAVAYHELCGKLMEACSLPLVVDPVDWDVNAETGMRLGPNNAGDSYYLDFGNGAMEIGHIESVGHIAIGRRLDHNEKVLADAAKSQDGGLFVVFVENKNVANVIAVRLTDEGLRLVEEEAARQGATTPGQAV